jgi:MFS family permease
MTPASPVNRDLTLLFVVMITIAAGNTALQSVLPALGRSLDVPDSAIAGIFSVSALVWVIAAPIWARRSDRSGRRAMVLLGLVGFVSSVMLCGLFLMAGVRGWLSPLATIVAIVAARLLYGLLGSAAPPAAQAIIASRTTPEQRTKALTLLASAFGLGTIIGPALAPFFVMPFVGLAGPAFVFSAVGIVVIVVVLRYLTDDAPGTVSYGAASSYPSIGGEPTGASVVAATSARGADVKLRDPRIWPWMLIGLVMGHAQAMTGQAVSFLVIDRLGLPLETAQQAIGIVLMTGAGAALLAQWGLIPLLNLSPRLLVLAGSGIAAVGCLLTGFATTLNGIAVAFALACAGFGFIRPGFTAGASLAVGTADQGAVAGRTTAVNGAAFVLGPSIGVGLYELSKPLPYIAAAATLVVVIVYALVTLSPSDPGGSASRGK